MSDRRKRTYSDLTLDNPLLTSEIHQGSAQLLQISDSSCHPADHGTQYNSDKESVS